MKHGWELFQEHCASCHGEGRRGTGPARATVLEAPQDLRDPILLAARTDDQLARAIMQGGMFVGRSKWMPGFAAELSEQDVMDIVSLLRGDSIFLEECFPDATHYVQVYSDTRGPPVLAAYSLGLRDGRPVVVLRPELIPPDAHKLGYLMFAELALPNVGPTPTAFVADAEGKVTGMRVALPSPDNERARQDLELVVIQKVPKIPTLVPVLTEGAERLARIARRPGTVASPPANSPR